MIEFVATACQNPHCRYYLVHEGNKISRRGFNSAGHQLFICHECGKSFVETASTPLFGCHITKEEIVAVLLLIKQGDNISSIARKVNHHRDTIINLLKKLNANQNYVDRLIIDKALATKAETDVIWQTIRKHSKLIPIDGACGTFK